MKKTTICGNTPDSTRTLFVGLDTVLDGGWLVENAGNPYTLADLENALGIPGNDDDLIEQEIAEIKAIIADPSTPWEPVTEADVEYIRDTLAAWGLC